LYDGLVQYYRLIADKKYRILVMGSPSSSKASIARKIVDKIGDENSALLKSYDIRKQWKDLDFTVDGQMRHCYRILGLARGNPKPVTVIDMACPLPKMREILNPDIIVWVSDNPESEYKELNEMYVKPNTYDVECIDDSEESIEKIGKVISTKRI
jgi:hypothetical protein